MRRNIATFLKLGLVLTAFISATLILLRIMRLPLQDEFNNSIIHDKLDDIKVFNIYH